MTLLEDLQNIDLSGILDARASIQVSVEGPELQTVISGGAAQTALAGLGNSLGQLIDSIEEPADLLQPLMEAIAELAEPLLPDDLPLDQYLDAVREALTLLVSLFEKLDDDPESLMGLFGQSLDEMFEAVASVTERYTSVELNQLPALQNIFETVDRGFPSDPEAFADLALDILLPFPGDTLRAVRTAVNEVLEGSAAIAFPAGRVAGLEIALNGVATAAATGDAGQLEAALQELAHVRAHTIGSIQQDFFNLCTQLDGLRFDQLLEPVTVAGELLRTGEEGALEFLENLRVYIVAAREEIENIDPTQLVAFLDIIIDMIESTLRTELEAPIDAQVKKLEEWLRNLFRHLPLRMYRAKLSGFIHHIAQVIDEADLDRYAREVTDLLNEIESFVTSADLGTEVQDALAQAKQVLDDALDGVIGALETIGNEIEAVTAQAQAVLEQVVSVLADFRQAIDDVTAAVDQLGIEQAAQQVTDTLVELRSTAEDLLTVAPLPEPLRPLIEQLVAELESIDFDVVFDPVRAAVAEFDLPDEISQTMTEALATVNETIQNLIPAELIASIEAEINEALAVIGSFDPSTLLGGVTDFLDEAAGFIEGLDPQPIIAEIRGPYQAILDAVDAVHPNRLLAPVIEAYDDLLGNVSPPQPEAAAQNLNSALNAVGEQTARALAEPTRQLMSNGGGEAEFTDPENPPEADGPPELEAVRPGDLLRLFAYLPNKLREALAELEQSEAGVVLAAIDRLCGGLARDLRQLQGAVWQIEDRLTAGYEALLLPLGSAQINAQIAIQANFSAAEIDLNASMLAVAEAGPGQMRTALREDAQRMLRCARGAAGAAGGGVGAALERAAIALERCFLADLGEDLDAFLAALDPEPLAAELDALVMTILNRGPEWVAQLDDTFEQAIRRFMDMLHIFNPAVQAQKFFTVIDILREEMEILDPRRLAVELGEIHAAIRETLLAYDPAILAAEVKEVIDALATQIRALDPAALLGDLSIFDETVARIEAAIPTNALAGIGQSLETVGAEIAGLDPAALLESIEALGPRVLDAFTAVIEAIRREIVALLESLRYATGSVSVSVEAEVG